MARRGTYRWAGVVALACMIAWPATASALDSVTLTSGLMMEGDIIAEEDGYVKLRLKGRVMTFPRDSIEAIEYGPDSTAPSQVKEREEQDQEELEETQRKVKAIKIKARKPKREKSEEEEGVLPAGPVEESAQLVIPDQPSPEEQKLIDELREGPDKRGAARQLGERNALVALPNLIRALDDDSPYLRGEAAKSLRKMTGQNFGFNPTHRSRAVRLEAIKRWQNWYEEASGKRVPW